MKTCSQLTECKPLSFPPRAVSCFCRGNHFLTTDCVKKNREQMYFFNVWSFYCVFPAGWQDISRLLESTNISSASATGKRQDMQSLSSACCRRLCSESESVSVWGVGATQIQTSMDTLLIKWTDNVKRKILPVRSRGSDHYLHERGLL